MKKIFSVIVLGLAALSASAYVPTYELKVASSDQGTVLFKVNGAVVSQAAKGDKVTVEITPNDGYSVNEVTGEMYTTFEEAMAPSRVPLNKAITVSGSGNSWTFDMPDANAQVSIRYGNQLKPEWIGIINDVEYTGSAVTPKVTIKNGSKTLKEGTDYKLTYKDNTNVGTATVTIEALTSSAYGNPDPLLTVTFEITPANIDESKVVAPTPVKNLVYTGQSQQLITGGSCTGGEMMYSLDGNNWTAGYVSIVNAGTYDVFYRVVGDANHNSTDPKTVTVTVAPKALDAKMVSKIADQNYTGEAITPAVVVTDGKVTLEEGKDYEVAYADNVNAGTAKVTVTGKGNYAGTIETKFTIIPATGINNVDSGAPVDSDECYTLDGRRVNGSHKGIVINKGKKVIVK